MLTQELEGRLEKLASQEHLSLKFEEAIRKQPELEHQVSKLREMNEMYKWVNNSF